MFSVVSTLVGEATRETVDRYLYSHTVVVEFVDKGEGKFSALLLTRADTADRVRYLADYQLGRFASGLMFGSQIGEPHEIA